MSRLTDKLHQQSKETGVTQAMIARELDITQQAVNNLFNGRAASSAYWREIATMLKMSHDEMRALMIEAGRDPEKNTKFPTAAVPSIMHANYPKYGDVESEQHQPNARIAEQIPMSKPGRMLPVLGEAVGGENGEYVFNGQILDYVACPPSLQLVPDAYSVWVDGESMSPRYRPGELVYVHPNRPPRRGDDVIVQVRPKGEDMPPHGFIKEMVAWTANKLVLKQYNPEKTIEFERDSIISVHPIVLSGKYL